MEHVETGIARAKRPAAVIKVPSLVISPGLIEL